MKIKKVIVGVLSVFVASSGILPPTAMKAAGSVDASIEKDYIQLSNDAISRKFAIQNGHVSTSEIDNKRSHQSLIPGKGSEDFIVNLLTDVETDTEQQFNKHPIYIVEGVDTKIQQAEWKASLVNAKQESFSATEVAKLFDNDVQTYVENYKISGQPFTLSIDLGSEQAISSMSVNKRPGYKEEAYGINGTMGGYVVSVKQQESDEWTQVAKGEFGKKDYNLHKENELFNVGDMVYVNFDEVQAQYVKVEQTSVAYGTAEEFSSAEISFYHKQLKKVQKVVEPTKVLNREMWKASLQNASGTKFAEAQLAKLFDGKLNTNVDQYQVNGMPFTLDIDLGEVQKVSSISVDKRPGFNDANYGTNGSMGEFELYVSEDGADWHIAGAGKFTKDAYQLHDNEDGSLHNVGERVYANFLRAYETRYVRLVQTSCAMGSAAEFTSAEFNLYEDEYIGPNWNTDIKSQQLPGVIRASDLTYEDAEISTIENGKKVTIAYEPFVKNDVTYDIDQVIVLENDDHYMRSFIEISVDDQDKARIDYIDQDHFVIPADAVGVWGHPDDSAISSMWIGKHELMLGQPIYVNSLFMGSEFPATDTIVKDNETQIRYYSGKNFTKMKEDGQLTTDGKFVSWQNVIGAARSSDTSVVQTDFFAYIEDIATPTQFRKQYNSWYDNMMNISDESIAKSFNGAEAGLTSEGVEPLDSYVVDDGWNNYYDGTFTNTPGSSQGTEKNQTGFWEFNAKFPNELYTSSALSDKFQSSFGLWVGPQGGYNYFGSFSKYLQSMGTGYVQSNSALGDVVCTGSHKYLNNFTNLFVDYQKRFNIDYWKWDGFASRPCNNADHDHMTGGENNMYFTSDMWESWINVFQTTRDARAKEGKDLFINATCYINLSPWLLQWVNTIWLQDSGDTGQLGTGERHEQKIYYRDEVYYKLYKQNQIQFPLKNIYNHDPIYGVSDGSNATTEVFREYLMANAVRGTAFWELYYSPSMFDEAKWKVNADVLEFAQSNHEILKNAKLFGNQPSKGVYGYSSWSGLEGIISFTNPKDTEQIYEVKIDEKIGADPALHNAKGVQIEPYVAGIMAQQISYGDTLQVTLKPHETLIYQYGKEDVSAPSLLSAKVTGKDQITLKFSERVSDTNVYSVNDKEVSSSLKEDYRTVVLHTTDPLSKDSNTSIKIQGVSDSYGNVATIETSTSAYENEVIASAVTKEDLKDAKDVKEIAFKEDINFLKISGKKEIKTTNAFAGKTDFAVSMAVKTNSKDTTLFKQGEDIALKIDAQGYLVFNVKDMSVSSKEKQTTVVEKAHGLFGTDAYVPTTTQTNVIGKVDDGNIHTIGAVREPNGMLKLYLDGNLVSSAYDEKSANQDILSGTMYIGDQTFSGYLSNLIIKNTSMDYADAEKLNNMYRQEKAEMLDRSDWIASACSEMSGAIGDSNAMAAIDGKTSTWWHTNYNGKDTDKVGEHWLAIEFGKESSFDNFIYQSRGGSNGDIKDFTLEAKVDGVWKTIKEGAFTSQKVNTITLDETVQASAIRLRPVSTQNGANYAAAVEINVSKNVEPNATDEQIQALKNLAAAINAEDYTKASATAYVTIYDQIQGLESFSVKLSALQKLEQQLATAKQELVSVVQLRKVMSDAVLIIEDADSYTLESIKKLEATLAEAEVVLEKDNASAYEIDKCVESIELAIKNMVKEEGTTFAKTILKSAIDKAMIAEASAAFETLAPSVKALITSMRMAAQSVYADAAATNQECMDAWLNLADALHFLDFQANKKALDNLISECDKLNTEDYKEGVKEFKAALATAHGVSLNLNALQESIDKAYNDLEIARAGLVNNDTDVDKSLLESMIASISQKVGNGEKYKKDDNWKAYEAAMAEAKAVMENTKATQSEVNAAFTKLTGAYENIRLLPTEEQLAELNGYLAVVRGIKRTNFTKAQLQKIDETTAKVNEMVNDFDGNKFPALQKELASTLEMINDVTIHESVKPVDPNKNGSTNAASPNTGDNTDVAAIAFAVLVGGCGVAMMQRKRRKTRV